MAAGTVLAMSATALTATYPYNVNVPVFGGTALTATRSATGNGQMIQATSIGGGYSGGIYANITSNGTNHLSSSNAELYTNGVKNYLDTRATVGERIQGFFWKAFYTVLEIETRCWLWGQRR
jgi:hypothetical protein